MIRQWPIRLCSALCSSSSDLRSLVRRQHRLAAVPADPHANGFHVETFRDYAIMRGDADDGASSAVHQSPIELLFTFRALSADG
jgi:hypothetical protein